MFDSFCTTKESSLGWQPSRWQRLRVRAGRAAVFLAGGKFAAVNSLVIRDPQRHPFYPVLSSGLGWTRTSTNSRFSARAALKLASVCFCEEIICCTR
jgi:hypothetical protein